jgi:cell division protein FtsB
MSSSAAQLRTRVPRIAEAAVERVRLRVVPPRRTQAARVPFVALVSLVLLGGVIGLLLFNTSMQQAAFATTALEQQAETLAARQQTLEMELDVLRNPQRVAERAQAMGMVPSGTPAYLLLENGKVLGEPTPATPQNTLRLKARPPVKPALLDPAPVVRQVVAQGPTAVTLTGRGNEGRPVVRTNGRDSREN